MNKQQIIENTKLFVQQRLSDDYTGHDWWHVERVWKTAKYIALAEGADLFIVELTALLHDIADWKFHNGDENVGPETARNWLSTQGVEPALIEKIANTIFNMSFKGANVGSNLQTLEGFVVQDADRLDAIGAIGIARAFAFGGAFSQPIYDPNTSVTYHDTFESYKNKKTTSINHFYEKLLLLKDRMNTETGKNLAQNRHHFMQQFLNQFHQDWESNFSSASTESMV